ncbi:MAG TPA: ABC transporter ATP-binding protein [Longimicrobiales bacterium]
MNVISTSNLTKRYGRFSNAVVAVDAISFAVERGQVFGFLGPNGSGKTTTIGMLLGIITPTAGNVRLLGLEGSRGLHQARQRIGATLETPNFYPYLSGRENLRVVANVKRAGDKQIDEALDLVGLTKRQKHRFATYSLGMKQRLALAATMLGDPELIILDEPANGLDPEGMREIREIIRALADRGKTIFLSSHLLWEVERTCTHVAIISRGRIIRHSSVRDITAGSTVAALRGGEQEILRTIVATYPEAISARTSGEDVLVELRSNDLGSLNRYIAERGIYLTHLTLQQHTLEDVFMDLTRDETRAGVA